MDENTISILVQFVELVAFIIILSRTKSSILSKVKGNFEAILQFIGQDSFFDTLDKALAKAEKSLDNNVEEQRKLIADIAIAQTKLNNLRENKASIEATIQNIKDLQ